MIVAESFVGSASRLTPNESQKLWQLVQKFMANPANPGFSLERVQRARDRNVWSARISSDLRAILHKEGDTWTALYAGHHDDAYEWAARRTVERHAKTGAMQIVYAPEFVQETLAASPPAPATAPALYAECTDEYLLSLGVPESWLPTVRMLKTEEQMLDAVAVLPEEVGMRLIDVANGKIVTPPVPLLPTQPAIESADSRRRFFVLNTEEDLLPILEAPLAQWLVFLHPSQRQVAEGSFNGPVKVSGSAGTGKTVVAMHRAANLAREGKKVLLTTYNRTLAGDIERNMKLFGEHGWNSRVTVSSLDQQALDIVRKIDPRTTPVVDNDVEGFIERALFSVTSDFDKAFLISEWQAVIETQGITTWDAYRDAPRTGRKRALSAKQRKDLWKVYEHVFDRMREGHRLTFSFICSRAAELLKEGRVSRPYDSVIVDELQDLKPQQLRFIAALAGEGPNRLMVAGDLGQRIYGRGISLLQCGIDVRGRSHVLRVNYRTTEQIRRQADRLLGHEVDDPDDAANTRKGTRSVLQGPNPEMKGFDSGDAQAAWIVEKIRGVKVPHEEVAVFARTNTLAKNLHKAVQDAGLDAMLLKEDLPDQPGVRFGTMHRAKGLEFKVVFAADCSASELPNQPTLREATDAAEKEDVMRRERQLLYVSMTRARDELFITWVGKPCEFLARLSVVENEGVPA